MVKKTYNARNKLFRRVTFRERYENAREYVLAAKRASPHKLQEILFKQTAHGPKLHSQFPLHSTPQVLHVLRVNIDVYRIHEASFVHYDRMHIDSAFQCLEIRIASPPVGYDVRSRKDMFQYSFLHRFHSMVVYFDEEALPGSSFEAPKDPTAIADTTPVVLLTREFTFVNFNS